MWLTHLSLLGRGSKWTFSITTCSGVLRRTRKLLGCTARSELKRSYTGVLVSCLGSLIASVATIHIARSANSHNMDNLCVSPRPEPSMSFDALLLALPWPATSDQELPPHLLNRKWTWLLPLSPSLVCANKGPHVSCPCHCNHLKFSHNNEVGRSRFRLGSKALCWQAVSTMQLESPEPHYLCM